MLWLLCRAFVRPICYNMFSVEQKIIVVILSSFGILDFLSKRCLIDYHSGKEMVLFWA